MFLVADEQHKRFFYFVKFTGRKIFLKLKEKKFRHNQYINYAKYFGMYPDRAVCRWDGS